MEKCKSCYWCLENGECAQKETQSTCTNYLELCSKCRVQYRNYIYKGIVYCEECLAIELGIEARDRHSCDWYVNDEYVGNDDELTFTDVLNKLNVKVVEF
jgi:hypothetical protein